MSFEVTVGQTRGWGFQKVKSWCLFWRGCMDKGVQATSLSHTVIWIGETLSLFSSLVISHHEHSLTSLDEYIFHGHQKREGVKHWLPLINGGQGCTCKKNVTDLWQCKEDGWSWCMKNVYKKKQCYFSIFIHTPTAYFIIALMTFLIHVCQNNNLDDNEIIMI